MLPEPPPIASTTNSPTFEPNRGMISVKHMIIPFDEFIGECLQGQFFSRYGNSLIIELYVYRILDSNELNSLNTCVVGGCSKVPNFFAMRVLKIHFRSYQGYKCFGFFFSHSVCSMPPQKMLQMEVHPHFKGN